MSRSKYDKPFYVDIGKDIASIRCSSNGDVIDSMDHYGKEHAIKIVDRTCDRMNKECELSVAKSATTTGNAAAMRSCLLKILAEMTDLGGMECGRKAYFSPDAIANEIQEALAVEKSSAVGNAAAMREALESCMNYLQRIDHPMNDYMRGLFETAYKQTKSALSKPPRNCDVGDAEEQADRFGKLCNKYYNDEYKCDERCPLASMNSIQGFPRCQAYWAQMPYEDGGAE